MRDCKYVCIGQLIECGVTGIRATPQGYREFCNMVDRIVKQAGDPAFSDEDVCQVLLVAALEAPGPIGWVLTRAIRSGAVPGLVRSQTGGQDRIDQAKRIFDRDTEVELSASILTGSPKFLDLLIDIEDTLGSEFGWAVEFMASGSTKRDVMELIGLTRQEVEKITELVYKHYSGGSKRSIRKSTGGELAATQPHGYTSTLKSEGESYEQYIERRLQSVRSSD